MALRHLIEEGQALLYMEAVQKKAQLSGDDANIKKIERTAEKSDKVNVRVEKSKAERLLQMAKAMGLKKERMTPSVSKRPGQRNKVALVLHKKKEEAPGTLAEDIRRLRDDALRGDRQAFDMYVRELTRGGVSAPSQELVVLWSKAPTPALQYAIENLLRNRDYQLSWSWRVETNNRVRDELYKRGNYRWIEGPVKAVAYRLQGALRSRRISVRAEGTMISLDFPVPVSIAEADSMGNLIQRGLVDHLDSLNGDGYSDLAVRQLYFFPNVTIDGPE